MEGSGLVGPTTECQYRGPHALFAVRHEPEGTDARSPIVGFDIERSNLPRLGGGPIGSRSALRSLERIAELQDSGTATLTNVHIDMGVIVKSLHRASGRFHLLHPVVSVLAADSIADSRSSSGKLFLG
eukprot:6135259-Amphidinium_carterae.1